MRKNRLVLCVAGRWAYATPIPEFNNDGAYVEAIFGEIEIVGNSPVLRIPRADSR